MKKSLFKNICLSLACLLGIGGLTGVVLSSPKEATKVSAASTYYTEKKTYLFLFNPETNKGATTLSEINNTGTWTVSRAPEDAKYNYSLWRGIPSSETVTFTRNQSLKHIYEIDVYVQQFYSKDDPTYYPVKGTVYVGGTVVSTATSDGKQESSSIFTNKLAYKGDEKDGAVKLSLNAVNSSTYSFYYNEIIIYYREYSAIPVTLNDNGGSGGSGTINCTYDEAMPASVKVPTRAGYRFDGYYNGTKQYYKADGKRAFTNFDIKAESATLTAKWTLMEFDITLDDNEGTGGQGSIKAIYGEAMPNLTTLPTRTGYTFQGYFSAKSGGTQYFDALGKGIGTYNLTSSTIVYARWEANKYHVSFEPTQGTGGITSLEATYDSPLRDLTSEEIPTRAPEHGHSYSFGGYYTQEPTEDENGYQTPNGKCYISDLGKGVLWKEASDTILYAYWSVDMSVTSSGYQGVWDNEYHGITVNVQSPEDATIYYGNQQGQCSDTNPEYFYKKDAGTYTIYFEVRKDSYTTYRDSETIVIEKNVSVIDPKPTSIEGLMFTNKDQALINAGTVNYGDMLYALSNEKLSDETKLQTLSFSKEIPTAKLVGTYYVYYKSSGDSNHYEYSASLDNYVEIAISRVDRSQAEALNATVLAYLETINQNYPEIAATLEAVRAEVYQEAIVKDNITAEEVANNVNLLQEALSAAKVSVTQTLIEAIGEVSYPTSEDKIKAAQDYFDSLTDDEKAAVDPSLRTILENDNKNYNDAKTVADLINNIPAPSDSKEYYDAVKAAQDAYNALALSNPDAYNLVNNASDVDYEKVLNDNVRASEVIKEIQDIGEVTYNKGEGDSLAAIESAEANYANLTEDQKALVNAANKSDLDHDREVYDNVDATVDLINAIGEVSHSEDKDSKEALDEARAAYDNLSEEEKALVNSYNDSYQTLVDDEAVYEVMVKIDEIGNVEYDSRSEDAINEAREFYDSLTEEQKAQLGDEYLNTLTTAETKYCELKKTADIWVIILLIIASLAIIGGIWLLIVLLKKKKSDDDKNNQNGQNIKKEPVKVMSVGGFLPFMILTSNYLSGAWLALYIVAGVALLLWIAIMIIAIMKKKQVGPFKKKEASTSIDEEELVTITDENGNVFNIRFIKSFTAKLIQSPEETKKYYEELKNEVLSYKKTNSRISWHHDAINAGRNYVLKFAIRGKTLCVYLPLNADDYVDSKYKVEKVESKKYEDVPCLYRIKNDRRLGYAKELIAIVCANLGLEKGEEQHEVYSNLPYEKNKPLIERGLIKELRVQVNKPVETVIETKEDEEGNEVVVSQDNLGNKYETRYIKSFTAKLSQASDEVKDYYNELKNYALSYEGTLNRVSWNYDTISVNNKGILKFVIKRKNLYLYYALDTSKIGQKYKVEHVEYKKYEDVPTMLLVNQDKRKELSKELIDRLMRQNKCELGKNLNDEYRIPFESKEVLIKKGLIKEVKVKI